MDIDRDYQHELLLKLREAYPGYRYIDDLIADGDEDRYAANMMYLEGHGIVESNIQLGIDGHYAFGDPRLTHIGIDFLRDDGGLSAILGVVTIKIHDDTLKFLIQSKIEGSDLPPPDKKRYVDLLRELPAESTKHLVLKLVDLGLAESPGALQWLCKFLLERASQ